MLKKIAIAMLVNGVLLASVNAAAESSFPDQSKSNDYGIRISKADSNNPFPDQSKSNDYGIRAPA